MESDNWIHASAYNRIIPYSKPLHTSLKAEYDLIHPFLCRISERWDRLKKLEETLSRDPEHLKYRYALMFTH